MVIITHHGEKSELTTLRQEQIKRIATQAKNRFSKIDIQVVESEKINNLNLPSTGWIFFLKPGEIPLPNIIESAAVGFECYHAIWGGVLVQNDTTNILEHLEGTRFGCTDLPKLIFRNPEKWLNCSFFIRADKAQLATGNDLLDPKFYLEMWRHQQCIKLGVSFVIQNGVLNYQEQWENILKYVRSTSIIKQFDFDNQNLTFRIAYWNPYIESKLVSGHVFEDSQLLALKNIINPGATIVDVGANIGQHTIFFAKNLGAKKVIPIEPNPDFSNIIRENILLNQADNIDISFLGYGVGEKHEKCSIVESFANPQDTTVEYDENGNIPVYPLDDLIEEVIHLIKIDVDEHEMKVLFGMKNILKSIRPILAIEVLHPNLTEFLKMMEEFNYRIDHLFSNPQYTDIVAIPR